MCGAVKIQSICHIANHAHVANSNNIAVSKTYFSAEFPLTNSLTLNRNTEPRAESERVMPVVVLQWWRYNGGLWRERGLSRIAVIPHGGSMSNKRPHSSAPPPHDTQPPPLSSTQTSHEGGEPQPRCSSSPPAHRQMTVKMMIETLL